MYRYMAISPCWRLQNAASVPCRVQYRRFQAAESTSPRGAKVTRQRPATHNCGPPSVRLQGMDVGRRALPDAMGSGEGKSNITSHQQPLQQKQRAWTLRWHADTTPPHAPPCTADAERQTRACRYSARARRRRGAMFAFSSRRRRGRILGGEGAPACQLGAKRHFRVRRLLLSGRSNGRRNMCSGRARVRLWVRSPDLEGDDGWRHVM